MNNIKHQYTKPHAFSFLIKALNSREYKNVKKNNATSVRNSNLILLFILALNF